MLIDGRLIDPNPGDKDKLNGTLSRIDMVLERVNKFGWPAVFVVVFLGMFIGWIPSPINAIQAAMTLQSADMAKHAAASQEQHVALIKQQEDLIKLLRRICYNTSRDDQDRRNCIQ